MVGAKLVALMSEQWTVDCRPWTDPGTKKSSPVHHGFTFTPAVSLFVDVENEAEFDHTFERLSGGGAVLMEPANYGFSTKFAWLQDRFGVSWQLNLP